MQGRDFRPRRCAQGLRAAALAGLLFGGVAAAQLPELRPVEPVENDGAVQLATSVAKVETRIAADGRAREVELAEAASVRPGDRLRYRIAFTNLSGESIAPGIIQITNPLPEAVEYLEGSAFSREAQVQFSIDGGASFASAAALSLIDDGARRPAGPADYSAIHWTWNRALHPGETGTVSFDARLH